MSMQENGKARQDKVIVTNRIYCRACKKVYRVNELKEIPGHKIPKVDGSGESWQQILYHCPRCQKVLVCDVGNSNLVLMLIAAKIAP